MGPGDASQAGASGSGSLRTRSHSRADPRWTVQDMLILVNEIAVVEGECRNALSSYQKWSMIAENCTALEVVRNTNQCRRKWESLLVEYKHVRVWEANSGKDSYWSLGIERRKEIGLPLDFDKELYEAMDNFTKLQDQADTDPEDDPEDAEIDVLEAEESGPKPKRIRRWSTTQKKVTGERKHPDLEEELERSVPTCRSTPQKTATGEREQLLLEEELEKPVPTRLSTPHKIVTGERRQPVLDDKLETPVQVEEMEQIPRDCKPKRAGHRSTPRKGISEEKDQPRPEEEESEEPIPVVEQTKQVHEDPKPKRIRHQSTPKKTLSKEKKQSGPDPRVERMAENLWEKTELIHAILAGNPIENAGGELGDRKDDNTLKTESVRCKADKLISCLRDLAKNLEQLCDVVDE